MISTISRAVMVVVTACLMGERGVWARAMTAELEAIGNDRRALCFALGCLAAAWRELPLHGSGRFLLSRYGLALGVVLPVAAFHLGCGATAMRFLVTGHDPYLAMLAAGNHHQRVVSAAYVDAAPLLALLLLWLGLSHCLVAWHVVACRWKHAAMLMGCVACSAIALVACILSIQPSGYGIALQLAGLAAELAVVPALRAWQADLGRTQTASQVT